MTHESDSQFGRAAAILFAGALTESALTLLCYRLHLNIATVSLVLLLGVVIHALYASLMWSVAMGVIAVAFLDYFFIPPEFSWAVADPADLVDLLAFLAAALITSHLASTARRQAARVERRQKILAQLCLIGERLLSLDPHHDIVHQTLRITREALEIPAVCFFDGDRAVVYLAGETTTLPDYVRQAYIEGRDGRPAINIQTFCVRTGDIVRGSLGFEGLRHADIAGPSLSALIIAAIQRGLAIQNADLTEADMRAEAFRGAVLDALAHEFKTPLAVIMAASGGLQNSRTLMQTERDLAAEIESEAGRLNDLTSDLLRRKELEYAQLRARMTRVDIHRVVLALVERFRHQHPRRSIEFISEYAAPVYVTADPELLQLAATQLLDNAVKYSESGSRIEIRLNLSHAGVELRVWNGGDAIEPAARERIFQRFYRGRHGTERTPGTGLGLYAARKIVRAHGGTLIVDPNSGNFGNAFVLALPQSERENSDAGVTVQFVGRG